MTKSPKTLITSLSALVILAGCAASLPIPFQLVDSQSKVQKGTIYTDTQRIEVTVDGHVYKGFYIVASSTALSQSTSIQRYYPRNTITTFTSNNARSHLTADNGQRLSCEFLLEFRRALGECRSPAGAEFQLVADGISEKNN
jgi:hypothetical protein